MNATVAAHVLDPLLAPIDAKDSPFADMVEAVGVAVASYIRRLGPPGAPPWQLALSITTGGILAPRPRQIRFYPSV